VRVTFWTRTSSESSGVTPIRARRSSGRRIEATRSRSGGVAGSRPLHVAGLVSEGGFDSCTGQEYAGWIATVRRLPRSNERGSWVEPIDPRARRCEEIVDGPLLGHRPIVGPQVKGAEKSRSRR
jgi:hypothetical protein